MGGRGGGDGRALLLRAPPQHACSSLHQPNKTRPPPRANSPQKFDPEASGSAPKRLTLDAFIRGCLFLQTAARAFAAFDPERSGSITTNFSQFVYCASHVRRRIGGVGALTVGVFLSVCVGVFVGGPVIDVVIDQFLC